MLGTKWLSAGAFAAVLGAFSLPAAAQVLDACPLALTVAVMCFDDLGDGPPIVLTNFPASIGAGPDNATVAFTGLDIAGPFPRSYALLETGGDFNPPNSDVATLFGPGLVVFQSDIFSSPPTFGIPAGALVESGAFQEFDVDPHLSIFIRSDVSGPEPVSEPATTALLVAAFGALGLLGSGARPRNGIPSVRVSGITAKPGVRRRSRIENPLNG